MVALARLPLGQGYLLAAEWSAEVSYAFSEMERQARKIASWGPNVYVKIPVSNTRGEMSLDLIRRLAHTPELGGVAYPVFRYFGYIPRLLGALVGVRNAIRLALQFRVRAPRCAPLRAAALSGST